MVAINVSSCRCTIRPEPIIQGMDKRFIVRGALTGRNSTPRPPTGYTFDRSAASSLYQQ